VQSFAHIRELNVTGFHRRDHDWKAPRNWLNESSGGTDERSRARRIYLHEDRRFIRDDLTERATDAVEAERIHDQVLDGRSNVSALEPGARFTLTDTSTELDGEYLVTRVVHEWTDTIESGGTYDAIGVANGIRSLGVRPGRALPVNSPRMPAKDSRSCRSLTDAP
jgi:uncharacterized protein involved in type VI secretion and phage assembly